TVLHPGVFALAAPAANYTLSLHDALPIFRADRDGARDDMTLVTGPRPQPLFADGIVAIRIPAAIVILRHNGASLWLASRNGDGRSEEHTSELQSRENLVCRLLLEKKLPER